MMIRIFTLLLALAVATLIGFVLGRSGRWQDYEQRRLGVMQAIVRQMGPGQMLIVGDSIVEMQSLPPICGLVPINAGISGARSQDLHGFATAAIGLTGPSRVVFAVGVNDLLQGTDLKQWTAQTTELVDKWRGEPIIIGITAIRNADPATANRMNAILRGLAMGRGGIFVKGLSVQETYDGVHPSRAGARAWQERLAAACA
ncbi:lysophospholipase L1-like esterase [Sphingomonas sp. UYAg733]